MDRMPPARLRAAHESLVPGIRRSGDPAGRRRGLRHGPRRALRLSRRYLPQLDLPGSQAERPAQTALRARDAAGPVQHRAAAPWPYLPRVCGEVLADARRIRAEPLYDDAA